MTRHTLSAGLLLGMLALTPVAASAAPHDDGQYCDRGRSTIYERDNRYDRESFRDRDSFVFRARHGRESRRFFSRGVSRSNSFDSRWSWRGDRDDRRR